MSYWIAKNSRSFEVYERKAIRLIIIKITDGLGNQMFQYAYARALQNRTTKKIYLDIGDINNMQNEKARESGWVDLCDKREYQLDNFLISLPVITSNMLPTKNEIKYEKKRFLRYCNDLRLLPTVYLKEIDLGENGIKFTRYQNYYIEGYFFNRRNYEGIEDILHREFQLKRDICLPDNISKILKKRNTVSLHIRRGDFLRVGRNISESDYYMKAINYMQSKIDNLFLFIFSDDMEWVKNNMKFKNEYLLVSEYGFSDCEELTLMSMCKNNIIANSTFSYWGAWLNPNKEKIVIVPRGWRQKIIPDSWVLL